MAEGKYWCFTDFNDNYFELQRERLDDHVAAGTISYYIYQPEKCPQTGKSHLQGYVVLPKRRKRGAVQQLLGGNNIHVERRKGTHQEAKKYCTKESTKEGETVQGGIEPTLTPGRRTDLEFFVLAIREGKTISQLWEEHLGVMAKYPQFARNYQHHVREEKFRSTVQPFVPRAGWQMDLSTLLQQEPNARTVIWRWEPVGNTGKSHFALNYQPEESFTITGGKHADIQYAYKGQRIVFFDWARKQMETFPYNLVEQFKNGYFLVTKYESTPFRFHPPHVVIFANEQPEFGALSGDRWDCKIIE